MGVTNLVAVINNYASAVSLTDTEGKGTNISNLPFNQVGNPNSMAIPWWYRSNKDFNEHHIYLSASGLNYYIGQYQNNVYYSTSPPQSGNTTMGKYFSIPLMSTLLSPLTLTEAFPQLSSTQHPSSLQQLHMHSRMQRLSHKLVTPLFHFVHHQAVKASFHN